MGHLGGSGGGGVRSGCGGGSDFDCRVSTIFISFSTVASSASILLSWSSTVSSRRSEPIHDECTCKQPVVINSYLSIYLYINYTIVVLANCVPDREGLMSDLFLDSMGGSSVPSNIDWSSLLYQSSSGSGIFKSVVGVTPSAGVSLWDGELEGSLAASPSVDCGAVRSWGALKEVVASLSLDDSGGGSLAASPSVDGGALAASPSVDCGAGRSWGALKEVISLDDSGGGSLATSADVPLVASLLLVVLETASLDCGGFFLDPTVMMVPFLFSKWIKSMINYRNVCTHTHTHTHTMLLKYNIYLVPFCSGVSFLKVWVLG